MFIFFISLLILLIAIFLLNLFLSFIKIKSLYSENRDIKFKVINNVKVAYIKKGQGSPLLLIHGFMSSSICFKDIIESLSMENTVYAVDVIGFGLSDKSPELDYRRSSMAKIIHGFMKSEGIESFNLLGHSMGGEISIHMAINYPESINKLILVSSAGCQDINVMPDCIVKSPGIFNFLIANIFMTYYFQRISFEITVFDRKNYNRNIFDCIFSISKANIPPETLRQIADQADDCNVLPKLRFIKKKTLIIWGELDNVVPIRLGYKIHELIKDSRLEVIKSCKHNPYIERPREFLEILGRFLSSNS